MPDIALESIFLILCVAIAAFFAACEVAFLSISSVKMHSFLEANAPNSKSLARLRDNRRRVVISLLIGSNLANIAASVMATSISMSLFGEAGLGVAIGAMSFLLLTFGDIAPKSAATAYGDRIALLLAPIIEMFYFISYPLVLVFEFINHLIPGVYSRATGIERFSEDEVISAVRLGAKHMSITEKERELIENVLNFDDKIVGDVMTSAGNIVSLDAGMSVKDAYAKALESDYSRFPVLDKKTVVGNVHIKTIARALLKNPELKMKEIAAKPVLLGAHEKINVAFFRLQKFGRNMGMVINGKSEFVGVVTIEDLLEEIVGEIK